MSINNSFGRRHSLVNFWQVWRFCLVLGLFTFLGLFLFVFKISDVSVAFNFSSVDDFFQLPNLVFSATVFGFFAFCLLFFCNIWVFWLTFKRKKVASVVVFGYVAVFFAAFMVWIVAAGTRTNTISMVSLLGGSLVLAVPLVFAALTCVVCERVGVVNIALEGQLLVGAFFAAVVGTLFNNSYFALLAAPISGMLVAWVLAVFSVRYFVNQIIVGVVLNVLVVGLTGFLFSTLLKSSPQLYNSPPSLPVLSVPFLSEIPLFGSILFKQTIIVYIMFFCVALVYFGLYKTVWGLRLRAVGEHPKAADTVGIDVNRMRFWNVVLGGGFAGLGGAYFTLDAVNSFTQNMSSGKGFIALGAVILGRWNPVGAFFAALLFGFTDNLQSIMSIIAVPIPSQLLQMLPYVITIFVVAGVIGKAKVPAALGVPYSKL